MSYDIEKLKSKWKTTDVYSAAILALEVRSTAIEIKLVEIYVVTERNETALREANEKFGDEILVHNGVQLKNTETIRWIMIHFVDLEQLDVALDKHRRNSETEGTEEE